MLDAGVFRFDADKPLADRLADLERDLDSVLDEHRPSVVAVEELYAHYRHPRTAILMAHARGVTLLAASRRGLSVRHYAATRIKRHLTGNGRASKQQVQRAVRVTLALPVLPDPPDVADALAVALCCADDLAQSVPVPLDHVSPWRVGPSAEGCGRNSGTSRGLKPAARNTTTRNAPSRPFDEDAEEPS